MISNFSQGELFLQGLVSADELSTGQKRLSKSDLAKIRLLGVGHYLCSQGYVKGGVKCDVKHLKDHPMLPKCLLVGLRANATS